MCSLKEKGVPVEKQAKILFTHACRLVHEAAATTLLCRPAAVPLLNCSCKHNSCR